MANDEDTDRLTALEAALQTGDANPDDVRWAAGKLRGMTLAGLEFGILKSIDPDLLRPKTDFERCMLQLALVFNDFKDLTIVDNWLDQQKTSPGVSHHLGHWTGLRGHITRLLVGMLHEFLNFLTEHAAVINSAEFQQLVETTPQKTQRAWTELRLLSNKVDDHSAQRSLLFNALLQVRNHTVFHYSAIKALAAGYDAHFDRSADASRTNAYYAVGPTMEATRFYYADAAANAHLERIGKNKGIDLRARTSDALTELNRALGPLVANYIALRAGAPTGFFSPSKPANDTGGRGGTKRDRNRAKAARKARREGRRQ